MHHIPLSYFQGPDPEEHIGGVTASLPHSKTSHVTCDTRVTSNKRKNKSCRHELTSKAFKPLPHLSGPDQLRHPGQREVPILQLEHLPQVDGATHQVVGRDRAVFQQSTERRQPSVRATCPFGRESCTLDGLLMAWIWLGLTGANSKASYRCCKPLMLRA